MCYGPEFIAKAVREWIAAVGARTAFIEPGSPWENGYCESFNGKLRAQQSNLLHTKGSRDRDRKPAVPLQHGASSPLGYRPPAPDVIVWPELKEMVKTQPSVAIH